jgi:23S rRNA pseudouridine2605 synthase
LTLPKHRTELARALSKLGYCSRTKAASLIAEGQVMLNTQVIRDPYSVVDLDSDRIVVAGQTLQAAEKHYLMLNKPRGIVTSAADEQGRTTVYSLLEQHGLPWVSPIGRLDKASEGLLLFSNDTAWAAAITDPSKHIDKVYHVHVDRHVTQEELARMQRGVACDKKSSLAAKHVTLLRKGQRNCWLEVVLDEGRNRHIRRLLAAMEIGVLRLLRVSIGPVVLGSLPKGAVRALTATEIDALDPGDKHVTG